MINLGTSTMQDFALGDNLVERIDLGDTTIFDPYTTLTGTLPLSFNSRVAGALKNYRLYGDSDGAGVQTENLFDKSTALTGYEISGDSIVANPLWFVTDYIKVDPQTSYIAPTSSWGMGCLEYASKEGEPTRTIFNNITGVTTLSTTQYIRLNAKIDSIDSKIVVQGSTAPTTYIPFGYKIPILNTSGETENLFDTVTDESNRTDVVAGGLRWVFTNQIITVSQTATNQYPQIFIRGENYSKLQLVQNKTYYGKLYTSNVPSGSSIYLMIQTIPINQVNWKTIVILRSIFSSFSVSEEYSNIRYLLVCKGNNIQYNNTEIGIYLSESQEGPSTFIPHRYESNYDLFIGDSKLGATEYLDFSEQKIYKDVAGTLTPTDPPVAFPAITTYLGENTLSSTETVGNVMVKGRISEITS